MPDWSQRRRLTPLLGILAGGLAYAVLQTGAFGVHDVAVRAVLTGAVAGVTALLASMLTKRRVTR